MSNVKFARYAWGVIGFNIIVILWGAFVRATGSGAGCGSHWPLCNGTVVPKSMQSATIIEYSHRLSSGLALALVVVLFIWAFRSYPKGNTVRLGATLSLIFIFTEALVGAGLVLFEWVAKDVSIGRVVSMSVHLINTFLLLASLTLTAWWASGGAPLKFARRGLLLFAFILALTGVLFIGISGAITALGDTVFPAATLIEGLKQDFSPAAHIILRLRILHPIIAIVVGFYLIGLSGLLAMASSDDLRIQQSGSDQISRQAINRPLFLKRFALVLIALICTQLLAGLINIVLLAPVWMQIVHLLLADSIWIILILLAAVCFSEPAAVVQSNYMREPSENV